LPIPPPLKLRLATEADVAAIGKLIEHSVRVLQAGDYSPAQLEGALGTVFGVDTQIIADRTYFVIEDSRGQADQRIVACGGWSRRRTLFGSDRALDREDSFLDPSVEPAKIRAFFVHPSWVRKGLGTEILNACEEAASQAGFGRFELGATLTGERLYSARGYRATEQIDVPLPNGATLPIIRMTKSDPSSTTNKV
jgi:GNAT superfamily N-acetyltransferase